jgi:hypothetical protein
VRLAILLGQGELDAVETRLVPQEAEKQKQKHRQPMAWQ